MRKIDRFKNEIDKLGKDDIIKLNDYVVNYPSVYSYIDKLQLTRVRKGEYLKKDIKINIMNNQEYDANYLNKDKIILNEYSNVLVPKGITALEINGLTTQVSSKQEFILIKKVKFKTVNSNTKIVYSNSSIKNKKLLEIVEVFNALRFNVDIRIDILNGFLEDNKTFITLNLQEIIDEKGSCRLLYDLYYVFSNKYKDEKNAFELKKALNKTSKFSVAKVLMEV